MVSKVILNGVSIPVISFQKDQVESRSGRLLTKVTFDFKVRSGNEYHQITTLLYKMNFEVNVPEEAIEFTGTIHNYSTSFTNLYEENKVGLFHLELIELEDDE
ncbi:YkvR family protein [Alkalihalobacillus sp. MEB130]|uniref:DUF3219 family protein n=1 Tax=Alkalihalobacillus sp. MEB130 TaxID=2976704 RepID=UPI0028DE2D1E|nr:DUF3219 family protein [Alkalihalobacillus sp. MEB130]MDT8861070.1 YkvR family protein [Alkalihalobacillus sp. MEB130]